MTVDDPTIEKWRKPGQKPMQARAKNPAGPVEYKAFAEADNPPRVWLKCGAKAADDGPSYGYLMNVGTDTWSLVSLNYSIPLMVVITGEYLEPLAEAFMRNAVAWVQVFEPERFAPPPDGAPLVKEITVHRPNAKDPTHH